jgi:hypothetical protein
VSWWPGGLFLRSSTARCSFVFSLRNALFRENFPPAASRWNSAICLLTSSRSAGSFTPRCSYFRLARPMQSRLGAMCGGSALLDRLSEGDGDSQSSIYYHQYPLNLLLTLSIFLFSYLESRKGPCPRSGRGTAMAIPGQATRV